MVTRMRFLLLFPLVLLSFSVLAQRKKSKEATIAIPQSQQDSVQFEAVIVEAEKQLILENYAKALESFTTALEMNSQSAAVNFKIAEVLLKSDEGQNAIPYALRSTELQSGNKYYRIFLARLYQKVGFFIDAARTYEKILEKYPDEESTLYELAELYQNLGRVDEMFETFDKIEAQLGVKVEIVRERQRILMKRGNVDGVVAEYKKLIAAYPNETPYRIELIDFLMQNRREEEALAEIRKYEETETPSSRIVLLKSELAWRKGEKEQAYQLLEDAFAMSALDFEIKFQILTNYLSMGAEASDKNRLTEIAQNLADKNTDEFKAQAFVGDLYYQKGEKSTARDYYLKAIRLSPSNFSVWQNIINVEAELNEFDSLLAHSEEALEYFPNQAILYYFSGYGHLIKKNYKKSIRALDQGRKYTIDPELLTVFYGQLGDAYNGLSEHEKSDKSYEKALENKPNNDHVLNNYSYFLSLRKVNLDKALQMSTKLVELEPENATYLDTHGWVLYTNGAFKEAKKFLEKAVKLDEDGTVVEHFGDVLFQLGDVDEAILQWERARELGEASEMIEKKIADRKLYE